jgi:hypothetical protein
MAELADAPDLESGVERRGGSSPSRCTKKEGDHMWYDNRKQVVERLPELHTEHNGAKIYKHWNPSHESDWQGPPAYLFVDEEVVEYKWFCALCYAEGIDSIKITYIKESL